MRKFIPIMGLALAVTIVGMTTASAARADEMVVTKPVSTQGLDLSLANDQNVLRARIMKVARVVCAEVNENLDHSDPGFQGCVRDTFSNAWEQAEAKIAAAKSRSMVASASTK